jgi:hypothetical protein
MFSSLSTRIKIFCGLALLAGIACHAQIDPANQINWPTGSAGCVYAPGTNTCVSAGGTVSGQASGVIPLGSSATVIGAQSHMDDGVSNAGKITSTEPLVAPSVVTGTPSSGAQAAIPSGAHGMASDESSTAGVPATGVDYVRADSVTHQWLQSLNGAAETPFGGLASQAANTLLMNATGGSAVPNAVAMPTCTTGADLYNTATHTWSCVSTSGGGSSLPSVKAFTYTSNAGSVASITSSALTIAVGDLVVVQCNSAGSPSSILASSSVSNSWTTTTVHASGTSVSSVFNYSAITTGGSSTFTCTPNVSEAFQNMMVLVISGTTGTFNFEDGTAFTSSPGNSPQIAYNHSTSAKSITVGCDQNTVGIKFYGMNLSGSPATLYGNATFAAPAGAVACGFAVSPSPLTYSSFSFVGDNASANETFEVISFAY